MKEHMERTITIIGSIASSLGLLISIFILPKEMKLIGYIIASIIFLISAIAISYFFGIKKENKNQTIKIFQSRDDLIDFWNYQDIIKSSSNLIVLGGTIRAFITSAHLEWIKKVLKEKQVRILILNPASNGTLLRAQQENRTDSIYSDLNKTIYKLIEFYFSLNQLERENLIIKKYTSIPSSSMFMTDDRVAYTFYLNDKSSTNSLWYLIEKNKKSEIAFMKLHEHYESIWNHSIPINELDNYVVLFEGLPGSGKTTVSRILKSELKNSVFLDSDDYREKYKLLDILSSDEREILHKILVGDIYKNIAFGRIRFIMDVNLTTIHLRERLFSIFNKFKVDIYYFRMNASEDDLINRIEYKKGNDIFYKNQNLSSIQILEKVKGFSNRIRESEINSIKSYFEFNSSTNVIDYWSSSKLQKYNANNLLEIIETKINITKKYNESISAPNTRYS